MSLAEVFIAQFVQRYHERTGDPHLTVDTDFLSGATALADIIADIVLSKDTQ